MTAIFGICLITISVAAVAILLDHQGFALKILIYSFLFLIPGVFAYLLKVKKE